MKAILKKTLLNKFLWIFSLLFFSIQTHAQVENEQVEDENGRTLIGDIKIDDVQSIKDAYTYDPITDRYIYTRKIDGYDIQYPLFLTRQEYSDLIMRKTMLEYFQQKQSAIDGTATEEEQRDLLPRYYVNSKLFETIFGSNTIDIKPLGFAEVNLGVRYTKQDNPLISPRNRRTFTMDFDQKISLSMQGKVGTNMDVNINYDTQSTFQQQQMIKLQYTPNEDDIVQKIEVGNVSMPINNSLIRGSQNLFGAKAELQFGKTKITGVFSKQNSQTRTITTEGGGLVENFELFALDYDADRHFFLSQYFRNQYDDALKNYPYVNSRARITRVEVWITNKQNRIANRDNNFRNILAIQDLGETRLSNVPVERSIGIDVNTYPNFLLAPVNTPTNNANNQFNPGQIGNNFLNPGIRDINTAISGFNIPVVEGRDFVKLENARKLSPSEFKFHPQLGYISLNQRMSNDEVIAVAYEYTIGDKIYRVGEFGTDGLDATIVGQDQDGQDVPTSQSLILKLLKSSLTSTEEPVWDLMMKNVYMLPGAQNISQEGFRLNILYTDPSPLNYITPAGGAPLPEGVANTPLLNVFNLDRLNSTNDPEEGGDGFFDFVSSSVSDPFANANNSNPYSNSNSSGVQNTNTIDGITVDAQKGLIMFTSVEPFGDFLFKKLAENAGENYDNNASYNENQKKYVFKSMYRQSYSKAIQDAQKNKFQIKGKFRSQNGGLNIGMNVPQGSVVVTAGGRTLSEGIDYVVDYSSGRLEILDPSLDQSSTPINITVENNSMMGMNRRTFFGTHIEHTFNKKASLGATFLRLSEAPLTIKSAYGQESVNNTMVGLNFNYNSDAPFLTRWVNKLPNIDTDAPSSISFKGEFAYLIPGNSKVDQMNGEATSYIDDFEASKSNIDITSANSWYLASVPVGYGAEATDLSSGYKRSKLSWYNIDQVFYTSSRRPNGINENDVSSNRTRRIQKRELFPTMDIAAGEVLSLNSLDLTYYPRERGPYNFNPDFLATNSFSTPQNHWGGIMRAISSTNFERANIEFLEFWLMDPYTGNPNDAAEVSNTGKLMLNFGYISEDILQDGLKQYENGLPGANGQGATLSTIWGKVPASTALIYAFDTDPANRAIQDAGLDGILDDEEAVKFPQFAQYSDPAADNYEYFLNASGNILQRYKNYNGLQGNSPVSFSENDRGAKNLPDVEDIDGDNTMNTINAYFEYPVKIEPNPLIGENYVVDVQTETVTLQNGTTTPVKWVQYKVPISDLPQYAVGAITDLQSIRFMRMYVTGFTDEITLRFGSLSLVRNDWRRYQESLVENPNLAPLGTNTGFDVTTLSIIENFARQPIPYVLPPGLVRERINQNNTIINQNEQSLSLRVYKQSQNVTSTNGLEPGDSRAVFKSVNVDMRQYKKIRMFLHAESVDPPTSSDRLRDDEMVAFLRFGNDYTENFYQVEIPLKVTEWNTTSPEEIWKLANEIELQLDLLTKLKSMKNKDANYDSRYIYFKNEDEIDPSLASKINKLRIGVKGNPNFGLVRNMMLGVRNNTDVLYAHTGSPKDIRGDVWFNELRLSDMDKKGGWAALSVVDAKIADFASVNASAMKSTIGFGSIEQGPQERSREDVFQYNVATAVNVNQLLPKKWNLNIPFSYSISETTITPEYDPHNPDVRLKDMIQQASSSQEKKEIKNRAVDYTKRTSVNFIGVRKQRGEDQKQNFYDIENFTVSQTYNVVEQHNFEIESVLDQQTRTSLDYAYSFKPLNVEPFKDSKFKQNKNLKLISDLNFNFLPTSINFNSNVLRQFNRQKYRSLEVEGIPIKPLYRRNYNFNYNYGFNFNLTRSITLGYAASVNNIVRNYMDDNNRVNNDLDVWDGYFDVGEANARMQQFKLNYKLPINKIPYLSFIEADYGYTGDYSWQRSSIAFSNIEFEGMNYDLGNTIQNANTHRLNTTLSFDKIYKEIGLVPSSQRVKKPKTKQEAPKPGERVQRNQVVGNTNEDAKSHAFTDALIGIATSVKKIRIDYNETNGTALPGFLPGLGFFGSSKPTLGFIFGSQADVRYEAARRGYLSVFPEFNQEFSQVNTKRLMYNADIRPINNLTITLLGDRQYSKSLNEQFDVSNGIYNSRSPYEYGNFSISTILIKTAFSKNSVDFSETFNKFRANRIIIANRLANERGIDLNNPANLDQYGFPKGYGRTNQEVLIPAFLSAYTGGNPNSVKKGIFRDFPLPNWDVNYTGLVRIEWFKQRFTNFSLKHAYQANYTVNSFQTNYEYQIDRDALNTMGNYPAETVVGNINLTEQFRPLIGVGFETKSKVRFNGSINRDRLLSMSFDNNLLTEVHGTDYVFGFGFRIKDVRFNTDIEGAPNGGTIVSDLNVNFDFTWRQSKTIVRYLDYENNILGAGTDRYTIDMTANYQFSKNITGEFYYSHDFSQAVISTAFPVTNIRSGFRLRYNFGN